MFGLSSLLTPFFMGTVVGAIASGEVPAQGNGDPTASWTGLLPLVSGALFVAVAAYLAAVFLVSDSADDHELREYFRVRALAMAVIAGVAAVAGIVALHADARFVYDGLTGPGMPLVILSGVCGVAALWFLVSGPARAVRPAAVGATVAVIWGFFVAQHPYMLPESLTISAAAGNETTLLMVIIVFAIAAVTVVPSLGLLYVLAQREVLDYEHAEASEPAPGSRGT